MEEIDIRRVLSSNIKYYRGLRGWSQVVLAEKINISTNFLADIETEKSWVSSSTLSKLARIFEVEVYQLFMPKDKQTPETKEAIKSLANDISITLEHSINKLTEKYLA